MADNTFEILCKRVNKIWKNAQYDNSLKFNSTMDSSVPVLEYVYCICGNQYRIEFSVDRLPVRKDTDLAKILSDIKDKVPVCTKFNCIIAGEDGIKQRIILILE